MTNDAKLGMLAGVLGVIVAAVLFANAPPPDQPRAGAVALPAQKDAQPAQKDAPPKVATVAPIVAVPTEEKSDPLPSTPVARTRKEAEGQSTSRQPGADEEP